jgi:hypothetical protein
LNIERSRERLKTEFLGTLLPDPVQSRKIGSLTGAAHNYTA